MCDDGEREMQQRKISNQQLTMKIRRYCPSGNSEERKVLWVLVAPRRPASFFLRGTINPSTGMCLEFYGTCCAYPSASPGRLIRIWSADDIRGLRSLGIPAKCPTIRVFPDLKSMLMYLLRWWAKQSGGKQFANTQYWKNPNVELMALVTKSLFYSRKHRIQ